MRHISGIILVICFYYKLFKNEIYVKELFIFFCFCLLKNRMPSVFSELRTRACSLESVL